MSQCTVVGGGGSPPSSPNRGALDSDGYSTASKATGHQCHCRGHRGSREKKRLAPARLDMLIFKSTDPGAEVTYTLWCFDVDAFLEQYDEASMHLKCLAWAIYDGALLVGSQPELSGDHQWCTMLAGIYKHIYRSHDDATHCPPYTLASWDCQQRT